MRCVMSLVQAGADVSGVWRTFVKIFPASTSQPITFQQMVVCEVLTQVRLRTRGNFRPQNDSWHSKTGRATLPTLSLA